MLKPLAAATIAISICSSAIATEYPAHGITFVVPFAAGGPTDTVARAIAGPMSKSLGQPIIIENVAGAGGSVGVGRAVHASPDGYTLSVGNWSTHVINGAMYTLRYDLLNDLEPIARLPSAHQLIVARKGVAANSLRELVAWMKGRTTWLAPRVSEARATSVPCCSKARPGRGSRPCITAARRPR